MKNYAFIILLCLLALIATRAYYVSTNPWPSRDVDMKAAFIAGAACQTESMQAVQGIKEAYRGRTDINDILSYEALLKEIRDKFNECERRTLRGGGEK